MSTPNYRETPGGDIWEECTVIEQGNSLRKDFLRFMICATGNMNRPEFGQA